MAIARGVKSFKERKERSGGGSERSGGIWNFKLKDGEEAIVWFRGLFVPTRSEKVLRAMDDDQLATFAELCQVHRREKDGKRETLLDATIRRMLQEEPAAAAEHWLRGGTMLCADVCPHPTVAGCVPCYERRNGDKQIKQARDIRCFSILDTRKFHKIAGSKDDKNTYETCTADDGVCKLCKKASEKGPVYPARMTGLRKWTAGAKWATAIVGLNDQLARKCLSCGKGRIKVTGYACGNPDCGELLEDIDSCDTPVRCVACRGKLFPIEELSCTKCSNPVRGSIMHAPVTVSRTGETKDDTSYSFMAGDFETPPDEVLAIEPVDWEQELRPPSTGEQAAKLGLRRDPFGGKGVGGASYDDDDDEDEKPRSKKRPSRRDDDDDDD